MAKIKAEREKKRRERNKVARTTIIEQKILKELPLQGMYLVRLTKIRYRNNPEAFIDFRVFQRAYDDDGKEIYYPTRRGVQIQQDKFTRLLEGVYLEGLDELIKKDPR